MSFGGWGVARTIAVIVALSGCDGCHTYTLGIPKIVVLSGRVGVSQVLRAELPSKQSADWMIFSRGHAVPPLGAESGIDVDAVLFSTTRCEEAQCVAGIPKSALLAADFFVTPGAMEGPLDPASRLVGTTPGGRFLDPEAASLDTPDANRQTRSGFVSLGTNGRLAAHARLSDQYYAYVAIAGATPSSSLRQEIDPNDSVISFFAGTINLVEEPRISPDARISAAMRSLVPCTPLPVYRALLKAARDAEVACLQPRFADVAGKLSKLDVENLELLCYGSAEDPGCGTATPQSVSLNQSKFGLVAAPCGAARQSILGGLLLDAVTQPREREAIENAFQRCATAANPDPPPNPTPKPIPTGDLPTCLDDMRRLLNSDKQQPATCSGITLSFERIGRFIGVDVGNDGAADYLILPQSGGLAATDPRPKIFNCGDKTEEIRRNFQKALAEGLACLARGSRDLAAEFLAGIMASPINIRCTELPPPQRPQYCAEFEEPPNPALPEQVTTIGVDLRLPCSTTPATMFHELLHSDNRFFQQPEHSNKEVTDQITSCEHVCFPGDRPATERERACCFSPSGAECRLLDNTVATAQWVQRWYTSSRTKTAKPECAPAQDSSHSSDMTISECSWVVLKENGDYVMKTSCKYGAAGSLHSIHNSACQDRKCVESELSLDTTKVQECETTIHTQNPAEYLSTNACDVDKVVENERRLTIDSTNCDGSPRHFEDDQPEPTWNNKLLFLGEQIRPAVDGFSGSRPPIWTKCPPPFHCEETFTWQIARPN